MAGIQHYLRRTVPRCSTIGISPICVYVLYHFSKAKINDFDMSLLVDEDVLRFQISVNHTHQVQALDSKDDLGDIKSGIVLTHEHLLLEEAEELATWQVLDDEIEIQFILEGLEHVAAKVVLAKLLEDIPFVHYVLDLFLATNILFSQLLDSVKSIAFGVVHQLHLPEAPLAK